MANEGIIKAWKGIAAAFCAAMLATLLAPAWGASAAHAAEANRLAIEIDAPAFQEEKVKIGGDVDRTFEVSNLADECYLRVKPTIELASDSVALESMHADPEEACWKKGSDGWYYLTRPLAEGEGESFSTRFAISADDKAIQHAQSGVSLRLVETGYAEAIQAKDTYPDFESDLPWEGAYKGEGEPETATDSTSANKGYKLGKTGDDAPWTILLALAGIAAAAMVVTGRRHDAETESVRKGSGR